MVTSNSTSAGTGQVFLILGRRNPAELFEKPILTASDVVFNASSSSELGAVGDVNGDGLSDFMISGRSDRFSEGAAFLFYGRRDEMLWPRMSELDSADAIFVGGGDSDHLPSVAGDINGDGLMDIVISTSISRAHYLFYGRNESDFSGVYELDEANASFSSDDAFTNVSSYSRVLEDINGDGFDEFIFPGRNFIPDPNHRLGYDPNSSRGEAYLFWGGTGNELLTGNLDVTDADVTFRTSRDNSNNLANVASGGDINRDGLGDLILSNLSFDAPNSARNGQTYVFLGSRTGFERPVIEIEAEANAEITGTFFSDSGNSLSGNGDFNGDGYSDFVIGMRGKVLQGTETKYGLFLGSSTFDSTGLELTTGAADFLVVGLTNDDVLFGSWSDIRGDFNGDGRADLLITAQSKVVDGVRQAGAVYVFFSVPEPPMWIGWGLAIIAIIHISQSNRKLP